MENRHQRNKDFRLHLVVENGGRRERNTDIVKKKKKKNMMKTFCFLMSTVSERKNEGATQ